MERRETFDAVAGLYAEARPGYPAALFDDLAAIAGLTVASRALEVGCGAGQATADLAQRVGALLALDPGPNLVAEARRRTAGAPVDFVVGRFEDFDGAGAPFDLIVSAQAWHWVAPQVAFPKAADLLRPGGWLAVFGHVYDLPQGELREVFARAFADHAPELWGRPHGSTSYRPQGPFGPFFAASGRFEPVVHRGYAWTWTINSDQLGRFLRTDSAYSVLPEDRREALFDALVTAAAARGEVHDWPNETHLYLARRL